MPTISPEKMEIIIDAISEKCKKIDCGLYASGGWNDHIHILITIPPKYSISKVVKMLKGYSSRIVNIKLSSDTTFRWQKGYSVFTISENRINHVINYISNQEIHHKNEKNNFSSSSSG